MTKLRMVMKSHYFPPKLYEAAMRKASEREENVSDVLREALERYVKKRVLHIHPDLNAAHDALTLHTVDAGRTKCGCQSCEIRATKAGRRRPEEL